MRIRSVTTILSLAILAGSIFAADARVGATGPNHRGNDRVETGERGAGDAESVNRRRNNCIVGAAPIDCPRTKPLTFEMEEKEDDCNCKPVAMQVGGQTRIVLDCYQTRMVNEVKRTYVCNRP